MELNEAIEHAREVAEGCPAGDRDCAYQHDKLVGWLEELKAYRATVVLPPVKVGDIAFFIINDAIYEGKIYYIRWEHHSSFGIQGLISADGLGGCIGAKLSDFGKTVFLSRKEAEAALANWRRRKHHELSMRRRQRLRL